MGYEDTVLPAALNLQKRNRAEGKSTSQSQRECPDEILTGYKFGSSDEFAMCGRPLCRRLLFCTSRSVGDNVREQDATNYDARDMHRSKQ